MFGNYFANHFHFILIPNDLSIFLSLLMVPLFEFSSLGRLVREPRASQGPRGRRLEVGCASRRCADGLR